jgi:hypothetical protein
MRSYEVQTHQEKTLLILSHTPREQVLKALDIGCETLFGLMECDYVAMWDDDDYSPPDRLARSVEEIGKLPEAAGGRVVGYKKGWFCSIRTLRAELVDVSADGHLWGGSLMFDEDAWCGMGMFERAPLPGYDRKLQEFALRGAIDAAEDALPVAFCHGKNMATFLRSAGSYADDLLKVMPKVVRDAVEDANEYFVKNRIHVPQPEV